MSLMGPDGECRDILQAKPVGALPRLTELELAQLATEAEGHLEAFNRLMAELRRERDVCDELVAACAGALAYMEGRGVYDTREHAAPLRVAIAKARVTP